MNLEQPDKSKDYHNVKNLQATLFPLFPKMTGYFANYLLKPQEIEDDDDNYNKIKTAGSKDLLAINRENNFQVQLARWPTECQVLSENIHHIATLSSSPELFYAKSGLEMQPKPTGDECGLIVYQYAPISAVNYFSRSSIGGSKYLLSTNICPEENTLKFESRFECGNLARAIRLTPNFYELYLRSDMYTHRYMQWFYFRVTNMKKNFLYRFSIVNFTKENSLYNTGLRPLMYSERDSQLHSIGWKRCGDQITYYCNDNVSEESEDQHMTYTLTFTVTFPHENDVVYFASCYPYTYTNLQDYLFELSNHPVKSTFTTLRLLCKSLAGNNVNYLTITSPQDEETKRKRAIVLTARVHPGETPSSWMMKGIIDFLTSDCAPAKELRDKFIFKIVPMLNPDGVIVGNNRCSLSGKDLNRQYRTVIRESYPSIWYTKLMVRRLIEECGVLMYCDLHGHSRKHNMFIYGCENRRDSKQKLQEQVFPLMLHKNAAEKFSFEDCSFRIQKGREGTGRIVMWMMGITNSYTLEASFAGSTLGSRDQTLFSAQDYEQMGKTFCQTLLDYYDEEPRKEKLRSKILNRLNEGGSNAEEPTNISISDYSSDDGSSSSSSDREINYLYEKEVITVPPPSPANERIPPKVNKKKQKLVKRKYDPLRRTIQMGKADLTLSLSETNFYICSGSSSESDEEKLIVKTATTKKSQLKTSKKNLKKKSQNFVHIDKLLNVENTLNHLLGDVLGARNQMMQLNYGIGNLKEDNVQLLSRIRYVEEKLRKIMGALQTEHEEITTLGNIIERNISSRILNQLAESLDYSDHCKNDEVTVYAINHDEETSSTEVAEFEIGNILLSVNSSSEEETNARDLKWTPSIIDLPGDQKFHHNKYVSSAERVSFISNFVKHYLKRAFVKKLKKYPVL